MTNGYCTSQPGEEGYAEPESIIPRVPPLRQGVQMVPEKWVTV